MSELVFVGVDVSKKWLDVAWTGRDGTARFANDKVGIKQILALLKKERPHCVAMEATGGYEKPLCEALLEASIAVGIANAKRVRDYAKALGLVAKTDFIDAKLIAKFAQAIGVTQLKAKSAAVRELEELSKRRADLIKLRTSEKNRLEHYTTKQVVASVTKSIRHLSAQLKAIDAQMKSIVRSDSDLRDQDSFQQEQTGVGAITSAVLLARLPELGTLNRKQIASLVGVAPFNRDSGEHRGKRFIGGGRSDVRTALYMATMTAIRNDKTLSATYARHMSKGKPPKVAIVACMRKFIVRLNAKVRDEMAISIAEVG